MSYHYKSIGVKNFKGFKEKVEFEVKPLTILTGPNNSGKSTITEVIGLLSESLEYTEGDPSVHARIAGWRYLNLKSHSTLKINNWREMVSKGSRDNIVHFFFKFYSSELKQDVEIAMGYEFIKTGAIIREYKISLGDWPVVDLISKDICQYYPERHVLAVSNRSHVYYGIEEYLQIRPNGEQKQIIWTSGKSDPTKKDFQKTLSFIRNYLRNKSGTKNSLPLLPKNKKRLLLKSSLWFEKMKDFKEHPNSEVLLKKEDRFLSEYKNFEDQFLYKLFHHIFHSPHQLIPYDQWKVEFKNDLDEYRYLVKNHPILKVRNLEKHEAVRTLEWSNLWSFERYNLSLQKILEIINSIDSSLTSEFVKELNEPISQDNLFNVDYINNLGKALYDSVCRFRETNDILFVESVLGIPKSFRSMDDIKPYYFLDEADHNNVHLYALAEEYLFNKNPEDGGTRWDIYGSKINFVNKWVNIFEIGDELIVEAIKSLDNVVAFSLYIIRGNEKYPVHMEGIGVQKLINLIIFLRNYRNHISLEEPEANLHPSHQSKLAELLVDTMALTSGRGRIGGYKKNAKRLNNDPLTLIVETHSEYLIRKVQYLIASEDSKLSTEDVSVNYMHSANKVPKGEKQVYGLKIREDGLMDNDFGPGFFDESLNLSLGLMGMKKD